jgi:hypothetical protein
MIDPKYIDRVTILFVCVVAGLAVASFLLANYFGSIALSEKNVADAAVRQLTLVTEMVKLVVTLATGLIGATVWLFTRPLTDDAELKKRICGEARLPVPLPILLFRLRRPESAFGGGPASIRAQIWFGGRRPCNITHSSSVRFSSE